MFASVVVAPTMTTLANLMEFELTIVRVVKFHISSEEIGSLMIEDLRSESLT